MGRIGFNSGASDTRDTASWNRGARVTFGHRGAACLFSIDSPLAEWSDARCRFPQTEGELGATLQVQIETAGRKRKMRAIRYPSAQLGKLHRTPGQRTGPTDSFQGSDVLGPMRGRWET